MFHSQLLDYENTNFHCKGCQNSYPFLQGPYAHSNDKKNICGWKYPKDTKGAKAISSLKYNKTQKQKTPIAKSTHSITTQLHVEPFQPLSKEANLLTKREET